jgi:hypothetical protein
MPRRMAAVSRHVERQGGSAGPDRKERAADWVSQLNFSFTSGVCMSKGR